MPEEMQKLRAELSDKDIGYEDLSDDFDRSFPFFDMTLYKTRYKFNDQVYVVVSGVGTQGGEWGLLELSVDQGEPIGSLTAEGILKIMGLYRG